MGRSGSPRRRTVPRSAGAGATPTGSLAAAGAGDAAPERPALIAHRGYDGLYVENTLGAMRAASRHGADLIEIDVLPCADDVIVVFHDLRLDAKTDEEGFVPETPCETVLGAEVLGSGQTIPTLTEVLETIPARIGVNVEFKDPGRYGRGARPTDADDRWLPFARRVLDIAAGYDNGILVSSFYDDALAAVREVDPSVPIASLFADSAERGLLVARQYDCEAIHPWKGITDEDLVMAAHDQGREVNPYTITTHAEATHLRDLGVDGVIADSPEVFATAST
ncbi:glycerophosphodiester phosphodiesterase [Halobacteriales archaeon QS_4_69_34]|nr:MAG: glycerophosphodiester phosphodiesterase [Halobacteriales archaeon QS_4_69_34]